MKINKEKLIEIILTALVGAGIAFLQSLLQGLSGIAIPHIDPATAASAAGIIHSARVLNC